MNGERWPTADWWYPSARQSKSSITMSYQQLTEGQRYQLSVLRAQGMSIRNRSPGRC
ncbi:transposase [Aeromonas media WS]|nr:transposase [Aeromonas media WS]